MGIVDGVLLLHSLSAVAPILGTAIADQEENLRGSVNFFQLGDGVAYGGAHASSVKRGDLVDTPLYLISKYFVDVLYYVELHVLSAVAREAVDAIGVSDSFQGLDEQRGTLLFQVDDALVVPAHQAFPAAAQPHHVLHRVIGGVPVVHHLTAFVDGFGGGCAHVQQEHHCHVSPVPVSVPVNFLIGRDFHPQVGPSFQSGVEVNVLAVEQPVDLLHALGHDQLKLALDVVGQREIIFQSVVVEGCVALLHDFLFDDAPPRLVVVGPKVPLVVGIGLRFPGLKLSSLVVVVEQRAVTLSRLRVGRRRSRLFHQILGEGAHTVVDVALFGIQLQL